MPSRPSGRPKAIHPKDVRVSVRLTEQEAELLERLAGGASLSATIRSCLTQMLQQQRRTGASLPDTPHAQLRRERRKARRADTPEAAALEPLFALDEPPDAEETTLVPSPPQEGPTVIYPVIVDRQPPREETEDIPVIDAEGRRGTIRVTKRMIT